MTEDLRPEPERFAFETCRLALRPLMDEDARPIARLINDRDIAAMLARVPHPYAVSDAEAFVGNQGGQTVFAVCLKHDEDMDELIGCCGLTLDASTMRAELGYWIGRSFWGKGLATECVQATIDHGFWTMHLDAIDVSCRVVNDASRRVIHKCGFQFVGATMIQTLASGRVSGERYVLERRSWASLKAWGRR